MSNDDNHNNNIIIIVVCTAMHFEEQRIVRNKILIMKDKIQYYDNG